MPCFLLLEFCLIYPRFRETTILSQSEVGFGFVAYDLHYISVLLLLMETISR